VIRLPEVLVKDLMQKPVQFIQIKKSVKDAATIMDKNNVGSLVVIRNGKPVGILTDTDIIRRVVAKNKKPETVKIINVMSKPLITVKPNETYLEAAKKLRKNNIKRLPVVSEVGKLIGLLSLSDIAVAVPEMLDLLESRLKLREETPVIKEETTSGICERCEIYSTNLKNVNDQWICETCRDDLVAEE